MTCFRLNFYSNSYWIKMMAGERGHLCITLLWMKFVQNISQKYIGIKFQVSGCCKTEHKTHTIFFTYLEIYWHLRWHVLFSNLTCQYEKLNTYYVLTTILTYIDSAYFTKYAEIPMHKKSSKNSVKKDKSTNGTIYVSICLFCFSVSILNLVLKIWDIVNTRLMNTDIFFVKNLGTYKFEFCKLVLW